MIITSIENEKIKTLLKLKQKKYRNSLNKFIVEGIDLVSIAIKTNNLLELYTTSDEVDFSNTFKITEGVMRKISFLKTPTTVLGVCKTFVDSTNLEDINGHVLIFDKIQDPGNMGTLLRSASAFGFKNIILNSTVDIYNEKVISATKGEIFNLNFFYFDTIRAIKNLKEKDYIIIGTSPSGGCVIDNKNKNIAIVLGNEGNGLSDEVLKEVDTVVSIKTSTVESLNVAVAGSILMYEASK